MPDRTRMLTAAPPAILAAAPLPAGPREGRA